MMTKLVKQSYPYSDDLWSAVLSSPFSFSHSLSDLQSDLKSGYVTSRPESIQLKETLDEFIAFLPVPGFKKEELEIQYHDQVLMISGKLSESEEKNDKLIGFVRKEFEQQAYVPDIQFDKAKAELDYGVLSIRLPKKVETLPQKLVVE